MIVMLGIFIDIIIICIMIVFVILIVKILGVDGVVVVFVWLSGEMGVFLLVFVFLYGLFIVGLGEWIVVLGLIFFVFIIIIVWSYYGECCVEFLFGVRIIIFYCYVWVFLVGVGVVFKLDIVWVFVFIMNVLMVLFNLIGLFFLSGFIFRFSWGEMV